MQPFFDVDKAEVEATNFLTTYPDDNRLVVGNWWCTVITVTEDAIWNVVVVPETSRDVKQARLVVAGTVLDLARPLEEFFILELFSCTGAGRGVLPLGRRDAKIGVGVLVECKTGRYSVRYDSIALRRPFAGPSLTVSPNYSGARVTIDYSTLKSSADGFVLGVTDPLDPDLARLFSVDSIDPYLLPVVELPPTETVTESFPRRWARTVIDAVAEAPEPAKPDPRVARAKDLFLRLDRIQPQTDGVRYLKSLIQFGTWGDEESLVALADEHALKIEVFRAGNTKPIVYNPKDVDDARAVRLRFAGSHYDLVFRQDDYYSLAAVSGTPIHELEQ